MAATIEDEGWDLALIDGYAAALRHATRVHGHGWPTDDGELNRAESVRQAIRLATAGIVSFMESNPDYPELIKQQTLSRQMQLPSADAVYHYARLHGRNSYRISGPRGSAHIFQISVWNGTCSNLRDYRLIDKKDSDTSADFAAGRDLDLVLSAEERPGSWLRLPEGPCEIFIRQYYADWDTEEPARLVIVREGAVYPPPPPTRAEIAERLGMVSDWLATQSAYYDKSIKFHLATDPAVLPQLQIPEAFQDNAYLNGHYRCGPDEAIVLEVTPPEAVYWGFQLANLQWEAMEYHMRQTSANFRQARIDTDGRLRIVISQRDPGVPNWFDTSGRSLGLLSGRYYKAKTVPIPTLTKLAFGELRRHLPADTPHVSPEQRQALIRARHASAFHRLCGDQ
ncbi:MAG TPA: DUF1214 domain-containing protein [Stellaceae bacterium]|nr:DUF1214 domain-containing protein [Stellaceae bacterium]